MRRLAASAAAALLLVLASICAVPPRAYACGCVTGNDDPGHVERAEVIFTGTVISERTLGYNRTYTFAVTKVYKGSAYAEQRVQTASQRSACGLDLNGSGPFLVLGAYAPNGTLLANACGGTTDTPASAELGPGSLPQPGVEPPNPPGLIWPAVGGLLVVSAVVLFFAWRRQSARPEG
jgi:hypothetical protein